MTWKQKKLIEKENRLKITRAGEGEEKLEEFWSKVQISFFLKKNYYYHFMVKNLPAMQGSWVWFLGQEDPLEKEMATYSSILACRIQLTEEPGGLKSMGSQELDMA